MKILFTFILFISIIQTNYAQQQVQYSYDNRGNRIKRFANGLRPASSKKTNSTALINEGEKTLDRESISVFPNPTSGKVILTINNFDAKETNSMSLLDAKGTVIITQPIANKVSEMNISELRSGVYLIQVIKNNQMLYYKLVKVD